MVIRPKIYIERNKSYVKTLKIAANPQRNKISKKIHDLFGYIPLFYKSVKLI